MRAIQLTLDKETTMKGSIRHVISASQFTLAMLTDLFQVTREIAEAWKKWQTAKKTDEATRREYLEDFWLEEIGMCSLFYEPSTRTRASFDVR